MDIENHNIPTEVRFYIIAQAAASFKQIDIVDLVLENCNFIVTQGAISKLLYKYKKEGEVGDRPRPGRPKKLFEEQEQAMIVAVEEDRTLTANAVSKDPHLNPSKQSHVSSRTITRTLNVHGLKGSISIVQEMSQDAMAERLAFAVQCQERQIRWERVIFSDESDLFPDQQAKPHYRRYEGERVDLDIGPLTARIQGKLKFGVD